MLWSLLRAHGGNKDEESLLRLEKNHTYGILGPDEEPGRHHVCLDQSTPGDAGAWMSQIDDDTLVSALSIPGTHDSAAYTRPWPFIATQTMTISQQLNAGIRYFDLRCGIQDDIAVMVHGPSLLGLSLSEVLDSMYSWLDLHPREGLIVQIKEDRAPERSKIHFAQVIFTCIASRSERWRTANTVPSLGELRGRIQLFRRFRGPSRMEYGIDVTEWKDNPVVPFTIFTSNRVQLTIQDHYSFPDPLALPELVSAKGGNVSGLLERASRDPEDSHFYLNYTSGYEFNLYYQIPPRQLAIGGYSRFRWEDGVNPRLRTYLKSKGCRSRYGIVAMDFPDVGTDDLVTTLIASNFEEEDEHPLKRLLISIALLIFFILLFFEGPRCLAYIATSGHARGQQRAAVP